MTQLANISPLNSNPSQYEQQRNLTDESDFASANRLQAKEEDTKQWSRIKITIDSIGRFRCRKRRRRGGGREYLEMQTGRTLVFTRGWLYSASKRGTPT